ncbi:MarR family winged helix-turn-helix transcriptional regulator [Fimbriimonas ginsengisoli]|uniref:Transcriptional regulator, MarR family n=1 Tax=Fimbriimonas ginsengisoli Gsoil 348 TaxID=661478 RepID=A0A068NS24_FIMGI|nr:MarR family transcriptional regulator [Fimbriimonas ginsengisoli]AIE86137.1 Transcriptional regulator, MarR family [Fimbriimonas ginsengisoli Gsoil 348]
MDGELTSAQKEAWIAFFVAHGALSKKIDRDMVEAGVVPMDTYDILLTLEMAPEKRLRMSELADRALLSRSGITRLVDRLERDGLLGRQSCPSDRRACHAVITEKGLAERERAWPVYRKSIAQHFASHLTEDEALKVTEVFSRMHVGCPGKTKPEDTCGV